MADCVELVDFDDETGQEKPVDPSAPNPNATEFDNLYLDMNGIIHPCTHPEDRPAPTTEEEMFTAVFDYIDRIFAIVRPRKLLYMAIDGVAPRAKINQQRSRRFRSAKETEEKQKIANELREEWAQHGFQVDQKEEKKDQLFDSNVITPGTPFMSRLAVALRKYVDQRIKNSPAWQQLFVIFSDASVPGEGEHKIAEYIRRERSQPGYNPDLKHVMYGLDADLIMLALATHEVNFTILREEVFPKRGGQRHGAQNQHQKKPQQVKQIDSVIVAQAQAAAKESGLQSRAELGGKKPFHFLHVHILREYLDYEFRTDIEREIAALTVATDMAYDLERVLDDFVFICFFVGNDFLPHLPTLDIREGAIDYLIELYKTEIAHIGYLTSSQGEVDFNRARKLLFKTGLKEDEVFKERSIREKASIERAAREKEEKKKTARMKRSAEDMELQNDDNTEQDVKPNPSKKSMHIKPSQRKYEFKSEEEMTMETVTLGRKEPPRIGSGEANAAATAALKAVLGRKRGNKTRASSSSGVDDSLVTENDDKKNNKTTKTESDTVSSKAVVLKSKPEFEEALKERIRQKNELDPFDTIKLGEEGWKARYYQQKFNWGPDDINQKMTLLRKYLEGLQWVMKYYYVGCVSWGWYYPYHYAPFASDLVECDITTSDIEFKIGKPFEPFTQLQAVMPASSGQLVLPECYSKLMTDPNSPIIDYYPENFELDLNGKRFAWQGVALLPFIDEKRLRNALKPLKNKLTEEENERNSFGECHVIVHNTSRLGKWRSRKKVESSEARSMSSIPDADACGQLFGRVSNVLPDFEDEESIVITLMFELPSFSPHSSELLPMAIQPGPLLNDAQRADSRRTGWKQAKFGTLGRAARDLSMDRERRLKHGHGYYDRSRKGQNHVQQQQQHHRGRRNSNEFQPDLPVINRPSTTGRTGVQNMFGGLGAPTGSMPSWMEGNRYQNTNMRRGGQGGHNGSYQRRQGYQGGRGGNNNDVDESGVYGVYTDNYREPSKQGGYYGARNSRQTGHSQSGWSQSGGWNSQNNNGYPTQGSGYQGYSPQNDQQWNNSTTQNHAYEGQQGNYASQGSEYAQGRSGGLAGPTAASFRQMNRGGHQQSNKSRNNNRQYDNWGGRGGGGGSRYY